MIGNLTDLVKSIKAQGIIRQNLEQARIYGKKEAA